jgi:hypothetical protein
MPPDVEDGSPGTATGGNEYTRSASLFAHVARSLANQEPASPVGASRTGCASGLRRSRAEAIIWTLKNQLGLERHGGRVPAGLSARIVQRLLALNACIWHNWQIGAPVKRSLIAFDQ